MGRNASVLLLLIVSLFYCNAQELSVTKPVLDTIGKSLVIKYDILNGEPDERYEVSLEVVDSKGRVVNSQSTAGDIGTNVEAGAGKQIFWDYQSDYVTDEVRIIVRIIIRRVPSDSFPDHSTSITAAYNTTSLMLQSLALPGLGLSKINNGNPYWLIGAGGYGIIAGSLMFHSSSKKNYDRFLNSSDPVAEDKYYNKHKSQKSASAVLLAGAATLWVTDMVIVYRSSSKRRIETSGSKDKILSLIPEYNMDYNTTIIKLRYMF